MSYPIAVKMIKFLVKLLVLSTTVSAVTTSTENTIVKDRTLNQTLPRSKLFSRSIQNAYNNRDRGQHSNLRALGNPVDWTMSKANLVAEFYTSEPAPTSQTYRSHSPKSNYGDRSHQKVLFPTRENYSSEVNNVKRSNSLKANGGNPSPPSSSSDYTESLMTSGTTYNAIPPNRVVDGRPKTPSSFRFPSNNNNHNGGGYSSAFTPLIKFPPFFSALSNSSPVSGYPLHQRPPRGPPLPPQQFYGPPQMTRPINGLRPPPPEAAQSSPPPSQYLPPPPQNSPNNPQPSQFAPQRPQHSPFMPVPSNHENFQQRNPPPPPGEYLPPKNESSNFTPSQQYLPQKQHTEVIPEQPQFQPGSPPPQILDNYRNQAVYPAPQSPPLDKKPLVYVMANATTEATPFQNKPAPFNHQPMDTFTNYENEPNSPPIPNPQHESPYMQMPSKPNTENLQNPGPIPPPLPSFPPQTQTSLPNLNLPNDLALTEPLSQVLADANAKSSDASDKTIRFVIHKPEDEDIVRNAILEDAQNRYEDVRFVQGPTLKVQRKETVYLPPKRKTVVYILLKEPQIDTDVQVMTPHEDEPAPEVYITYQKSDGAVKTKHYSPKPIRQEDMKKYLDIEEDSSYGSGQESRLHPRISKATSVSLSTSSKTLRTTASTSSSLASTEIMDAGNYFKESDNTSLLANHKMISNDTFPEENLKSTIPLLKPSPLLYSTFTNSSGRVSTNFNNTTNNDNNNLTTDPHSLIHYRLKKGRSPTYPRKTHSLPVLPPTPRRVLRTLHQCPTIK